MKTTSTRMDRLKTDDNNARTHDQRNVTTIKLSLERFGQQKPIVVTADGVIVAGNATYLAADELGWQTIETVTTELAVDDQVAFAIADNRIAELAAWDYPVLAEQLSGLLEKDFDPASLGWSEEEMGPLIDAEWQPPGLTSLTDDDPTDKQKALQLTGDEWGVISSAIEGFRVKNEAADTTDGQCLKAICAEWLL